MPDFSEYIRRMRLGRKLTQQQMASIIGINVRNYQRWESGRYCPSFKMIMSIIKNFGPDSLNETMQWQQKNAPTTVQS